MTMSPEKSVVVLGLPGSGKTTFLAALWHIVTERDIKTKLTFGGLRVGDSAHLNEIAKQWRNAVVQERTATSGSRLVSMNLVDEGTNTFRMTFPDVPGEAYQRMWEARDCEAEVAEGLRAAGVLLFIHADTIIKPRWVVDEARLAEELGIEMEGEGVEVAWRPTLAPTQVQLVDILQLLQRSPLNVGVRRIAVMLSAWDKVEEEGARPEEFLDTELPLLEQYLRQSINGWTVKVYGVSAQGGDYDEGSGAVAQPSADALRNLETASERIKLVDGDSVDHDLTEPIAWLVN